MYTFVNKSPRKDQFLLKSCADLRIATAFDVHSAARHLSKFHAQFLGPIRLRTAHFLIFARRKRLGRRLSTRLPRIWSWLAQRSDAISRGTD